MRDTLHLVEQHLIRREDNRFSVLDEACFHAKNIYNAGLYQLRQLLFVEGRSLSYAQQEKGFKRKDLLPDQQLPMKVVQQVLKGLHHDWDSFWAARAEYLVHPEKFKASPRLPHYKHKTKGRTTLTFTDQAISREALRKGKVVLSGLNVCVKTRQRHVDQVRVVPHSSHYTVEVMYSTTVAQVALDESLYAGVDMGVDVLAALTTNKPGFVPILVNGRPLKALNQFYNKCKAKLQSELPEGVYMSRRLQALTFSRNRRMDSLLHLASAYLVAVLVREGIGKLVIGKNDDWKQNTGMGKRSNQNFVYIPHARFIDMLTYKAQLVGIKVILINESHTSKCSFLDHEPICHHDKYMGKRIKRGLFRASDGQTMQADLNGSYNIIRRAAPTAFDKLPTVATHAKRLNPSAMQKHLQMWKHNGVVGRMP